MTTIIVESLFPGTSAEQVAKTWVEMKALPDSLTMVWAGAKSEVNLGTRGLAMYQCYKDKIDDSLHRVNKISKIKIRHQYLIIRGV
jgi:hypothetical protein